MKQRAMQPLPKSGDKVFPASQMPSCAQSYSMSLSPLGDDY